MSKRAEYRRKGRSAQANANQSNLGTWLTIGGVALVGAIILALIVTRQASAPSATTDPIRTQPNPEIPRVAVADAQARLGQPGVVFVDTRSPQEFSASHIPGAVNMPLPDVPNRFSELPQNAEIITYCT
ncbi:MAG: rhodanese-like domain-containing protein [Anaerolineae bacterium]|nr:rhodanese-like domain-containing protein [Anaerolineae bacterium]